MFLKKYTVNILKHVALLKLVLLSKKILNNEVYASRFICQKSWYDSNI